MESSNLRIPSISSSLQIASTASNLTEEGVKNLALASSGDFSNLGSDGSIEVASKGTNLLSRAPTLSKVGQMVPFVDTVSSDQREGPLKSNWLDDYNDISSPYKFGRYLWREYMAPYSWRWKLGLVGILAPVGR